MPKHKRPRQRRSAARPAQAPVVPAARYARGWQALPAVALLLLTVAVYWQTLAAGFVWDDKVFILQSAQIRAGWSGLAAIWLNPAAANELHYWPLLNTSFWLEHKLWGFNPAGFHAGNVVLHSANTLLLWRLLARMGLPGAWVVAALFALHPVHVESVAWITARKDLLSTLFYLLALSAWLRFRRQPSAAAYAALLLCYAAAVLSKTVAITLPAALLIWAWWRHGRVTARDFAHTAPLIALGLALGAYGWAYYAGRAHIAFEYAFAERVIIAAKALWFYAAKLIWPQPLLVIYPHWDVDPAKAANWLGLAAVALVGGALYMARRRIGRGPLAGVLFFAVTLAPMLGFADNSYMKFSFVADRYQYLACVGLLAVLVGAAVSAQRRLGPASPAAARALVAVPLIACAWLATQHARVFQDDAALFRHITMTNPAAPRAWSSLGAALIERSPAEAITAFKTALQYTPNDTYTHIRISEALIALQRYAEAEALLRDAMARGLDNDAGVDTPLRKDHLGAKIPYNLGFVLLQRQQPQAAAAAFRRVLELEPGNLQARTSLATALREQGRFTEALAQLRRAAESMPRPNADIYLRMAAAAAEQGDARAAEEYNRRALDLEPQNLAALRPFAATHFNAGRYAQAARVYRRILTIAPDDVEAHVHLAAALEQLGRPEQAQTVYQQALALQPNHRQALAGLALVYSGDGRFARAVPLLRRLVTLDPADVGTHINLGVALAESGRPAEAALSFERALALQPHNEAARAYLALTREKLERAR